MFSIVLKYFIIDCALKELYCVETFIIMNIIQPWCLWQKGKWTFYLHYNKSTFFPYIFILIINALADVCFVTFCSDRKRLSPTIFFSRSETSLSLSLSLHSPGHYLTLSLSPSPHTQAMDRWNVYLLHTIQFSQTKIYSSLKSRL